MIVRKILTIIQSHKQNFIAIKTAEEFLILVQDKFYQDEIA